MSERSVWDLIREKLGIEKEKKEYPTGEIYPTEKMSPEPTPEPITIEALVKSAKETLSSEETGDWKVLPSKFPRLDPFPTRTGTDATVPETVSESKTDDKQNPTDAKIENPPMTPPPTDEAQPEAPPVPPATVPAGERLSPDVLGVNEAMFDCLAEKGILRKKERLSLASNAHYGKVPYYYKGYSTSPAQYDPEIGGKTLAHVQDYIDNPDLPQFRMAKDGWKIQSLTNFVKADAQRLGCDKATQRAVRLYETATGKEQIYQMVRNHVSHLSKRARAKYIGAYGRRWWFPPHETLPPYVSHLRRGE